MHEQTAAIIVGFDVTDKLHVCNLRFALSEFYCDNRENLIVSYFSWTHTNRPSLKRNTLMDQKYTFILLLSKGWTFSSCPQFLPCLPWAWQNMPGEHCACTHFVDIVSRLCCVPVLLLVLFLMLRKSPKKQWCSLQKQQLMPALFFCSVFTLCDVFILSSYPISFCESYMCHGLQVKRGIALKCPWMQAEGSEQFHCIARVISEWQNKINVCYGSMNTW